MPNSSGKNQYQNDNIPNEDILHAALFQYAKECLPLQQRLTRLKKELNYDIKFVIHKLPSCHTYRNDRLTKLKQLNKAFDVPTVRNPPPAGVSTQLVLLALAEDVGGRKGTGGIRDKLKEKGWMIPRQIVRQTLRMFAPEGLDHRFPGSARIQRGRLTTLGPFHEIAGDGHAKLAAQALQMGGVGLPIYGLKDKYSSAIQWLVVLPNERLAAAIGHLYLDFVEGFKALPLQLTVDGGSETGEMLRFHKHLRAIKAPEVDKTEWPPYQKLLSIRNIAIEGLWHWFRENEGYGLFELITYGKTQGIFDHTSSLHRAVFYWIWPVVLQAKLDEFVIYWNNHTICSQPEKAMPSGMTPRHIYTCPEEWGAESLTIPLQTDEQDEADAFCWVDDDFDQAAQLLYQQLGSPPITALSAWDLFMAMLPVLQDMYGEE
ncbi:hypothetical protein JB92DRAFT_3080677 [Gautieria morchelliformis]|nr:hypothetical protein JB92DRAFT_3080677 [Gautieria morchelliformis]